MRAQRGEEGLGRGPGEVVGPVLLQCRDDIILLGSGKLSEGLAVGHTAVRLERGEAASIKVLLIRIGAREREVDVIEHTRLGRARLARGPRHQTLGKGGNGRRIVVIEESTMACSMPMHASFGGRGYHVALLVCLGDCVGDK